MLVPRVLVLVLAFAAPGCFRGTYAYSIRFAAGATDTTQGQVGGRVELTLGLNAEVGTSRHYVALSGHGAITRASGGGVEAADGVAAEWAMRHPRWMHRVGFDYSEAKTFDGDTRYLTVGARGALLLALSHGDEPGIQIGGDRPGLGSGGSLGEDADTDDAIETESRASLGIELGGSAIASGDASGGRGIGYAGLVFQYDILPQR